MGVTVNRYPLLWEPEDGLGTVGVAFPAPGKALSANDRPHKMQRAASVKSWRETTGVFASRVAWDGSPAYVTILAPSGVRDPMNLAPTAKAMIDGLVDGGWWPDDDAELVHVMQPIVLPVKYPLVGVVVSPMSWSPTCMDRERFAQAGWAMWMAHRFREVMVAHRQRRAA